MDTLTPRNIEEPSSRCNICGSGLSSVEALLYGNRCIFCAPEKRNISFVKFIQGVILDFFIYRKILKWSSLKENCEDCVDGKISQTVCNVGEFPTVDTFTCTSCNGSGKISPGRVKIIGYVGAVGAAYWEELTINQKWELLRSLK